MGEIYRFPSVAFRPDEYVRAKTLDEVRAVLKKFGDEARIVGGGVTLHELGAMGLLSRVRKLVDIQQLALDYVKPEADIIRIGASATIRQIAHHELFRREPGLRAIHEAGDFLPVQVTNLATVAGAICTGLPILSLPPALLAVGGTVKCVGSEGEREVPLDKFYMDYFLTELRSDELVTEIRIPRPGARDGSAFRCEKILAVDYPIASVAVKVSLGDQGRCEACAVAIGSLGRVPMRVNKVEDKLQGTSVNEEAVETAALILSKEIEPVSDLRASAEYRRRIARLLLREAFNSALSRARGEAS
jgi:carbon-monoxide dehydrogenase medium subunit